MTGSPRPTPSQTGTPRPTPTDPYPGGAVAPIAPDGDSFFRVSDTTETSGVDAGLSSILWIALAIFSVGLVVRWFYVAARSDDAG